MPIFLNRNKINKWLKLLIEKADRELIIIVPYIKLSDKVFKSLQKADKNNVDIVIIYRENELMKKEKAKLLTLKNISLLHHPNIHCKTYYNGELAVLASMNLYQHSEENNREMGIALFNEFYEEYNVEEKYKEEFLYYDDGGVFEDLNLEIREIIKGAKIDLITENVKKKKLELNILKNIIDVLHDECGEMNKVFLNKKFEVAEVDDELQIICTNYYDNIDLLVDAQRIRIKINHPEKRLKNAHSKWMKKYGEFHFVGFKQYWNYYSQVIYLYPDRKYDIWDSNGAENWIRNFKEGLDMVIKEYNKL